MFSLEWKGKTLLLLHWQQSSCHSIIFALPPLPPFLFPIMTHPLFSPHFFSHTVRFSCLRLSATSIFHCLSFWKWKPISGWTKQNQIGCGRRRVLVSQPFFFCSSLGFSFANPLWLESDTTEMKMIFDVSFSLHLSFFLLITAVIDCFQFNSYIHFVFQGIWSVRCGNQRSRNQALPLLPQDQ